MAVDLARLGIEIDSRSALTANRRLGRLAVTGGKTERQMVSLATSSRNLAGRIGMTAQQFQALGQTAQRIGKSLSVAVTLPLLGVGAAAAKVSVDFEKELTKINTLVGLSSEQVVGYREEVLNLSTEVGRGARELSKALFTVTSAGARGAEAMRILEQAGKASAIGLGDTQQIARATTAVLQAYGEENISAARATEILTSTVREGNLEASNLAPTIGRVLGMAKQLGITFEEVGANIATFTRLGVGAEEAVVGLRGVMNALIKPTSEGAEALAQAGISFNQLRESVQQRGLAETMRILVARFNGQDEALAKVIPNVRALANVLGTAGAQGEAYSKILDSIENGHGIVEEGFKTVGETAEFQWNQATAALEKAAIELGESVLPMMQELVAVVNDAAEWFSNLDDSTQRLITRFGLLAAAIGPIIFLLGKTISALPTLIGLLTGGAGLSGALATAKAAAIGLHAALTAFLSPIGLAVTAVSGILALLLGKYLSGTNKATEATKKFDKAISDSAGSVKEATKALEGMNTENMYSSTTNLLTQKRKEFRRLSELYKDINNLDSETLIAEGGRSNIKNRYQDLKDTIPQLEEQVKLIRELNKAENNLSMAKKQVAKWQNEANKDAYLQKYRERIDAIRTDLGLSLKYAEAQQEVKDANEGAVNSTENAAKAAIEKMKAIQLLNKAISGTPVSIDQANGALSTLQDAFNSVKTDEERRELSGYIEQLERLIKTLESAGEKVKSIDEIISGTPKAQKILNPQNVLDQAMMGMPVSLNELQQVQTKLQAAFNSAGTQEQRQRIQGYLDDVNNLIDKMNGVQNSTENAKKATGDFQKVADNLGFTFSSALEDAIVSARSLSDVLQGLIQDILRVIVRIKVVQPLVKGLQSFIGGLGGGTGGGTNANAKGGIFTGLSQFQGANGETEQFGEAGTEAVFPVTKMANGQYGVQGTGGGGNLEINIVNYSGEDVERQESKTANGGKRIDLMIGKAAADDVRRGGPLSRAIRDTFGSRRTPRRT